MKLSENTPRITRSQFVEVGQTIVMNGDLFEDGKQRIVVSDTLSQETIIELTEAMVERDEANYRLLMKIESINKILGLQPC